MTLGDSYRAKALAFFAHAETDPLNRAAFENLAFAYLRLAEQADRKSQLDLIYETPSSKINVQPWDISARYETHAAAMVSPERPKNSGGPRSSQPIGRAPPK